MSRATVIQTNFTAGELSPRMYGRVDVDRYPNGAKTIENCLPLIHGGCKSSPMLSYIADAKNADRKCRLVRFEFSKTQANVLEFGHNYIRFFDQDGNQIMDGGSPYEIATVFDETELFEVEYLGGADTIFLFHESHPIQRLRRFDNDNWSIEDTPFVIEPFAEQGSLPAAALTLSAATVGTGRTFTAGSAVFLEGDVGRYISYQGGNAIITGYTSTTVVTCTIETAFASTSVATGVWTLEGSPYLVCQPSEAATIGSTIDLDLSTGTVYGTKQTINAATFQAAAFPTTSGDDEIRFETAANHGISVGDTALVTGCFPLEYNGTYEAITDTTGVYLHVQYGPNPSSITTLGSVQEVTTTASENGFRAEDVGKFVKINGGLCLITSFVNATQVQARIIQTFSSDAPAQAGSWSLNSTVWNATNGYPRSGTFYQQRLIVGGSTQFPHTIYGSRSGEFLNFELGVNDDDAFSYEIDSTEYNPIMHLTSAKQKIIALTSGAEFTISGGVEKPITPTNIQIDDPTDYGSNTVKPVKIGNDACFFQRGGLKLRAMGYRLESDSFNSPDLTKLSEHITAGGVVDMAYQQEPESILWCVRDDGVMVTLSIDQSEGVLSWSRQVTSSGGCFESVCAIPDDTNGDQVWCVVKRTIGGQTVRHIERYETNLHFNLHSAISATSGGGTDTWAGLDHLEGETVDVLADGAVMQTATVASGSVTLERAANQVYIGLPVRPKIISLNPELLTQIGSAQGNHIRIHEIVLRLLDTYAANINGQYRDFRSFGSDLLDQAPPSFTGDLDVTKLGWKKSESITIEAANALPFHVLAIIMKVTVNGG